MDQKKPDRRVIKTKKAIRNAFAKLLVEMDIERISIKDIADTADINRKTFYSYYDGIYQVAEEIEDEMIRAFEETLLETDFQSAMQNPFVFFQKLSGVLNGDLDFYGHLYLSGARTNLNQKLVSLLLPKTMDALRPYAAVSDEDLRVAVRFALSGMITAYGEWYNSDRSMTIEHIAEIIGEMTIHGLRKYLKDES